MHMQCSKKAPLTLGRGDGSVVDNRWAWEVRLFEVVAAAARQRLLAHKSSPGDLHPSHGRPPLPPPTLPSSPAAREAGGPFSFPQAARGGKAGCLHGHGCGWALKILGAAAAVRLGSPPLTRLPTDPHHDH